MLHELGERHEARNPVVPLVLGLVSLAEHVRQLVLHPGAGTPPVSGPDPDLFLDALLGLLAVADHVLATAAAAAVPPPAEAAADRPPEPIGRAGLLR